MSDTDRIYQAIGKMVAMVALVFSLLFAAAWTIIHLAAWLEVAS